MIKKIKLVFVFFLFFLFINLSCASNIFTFTEGDLVKIKFKAADPDQDKLFLSYSPPLNESGEWQTTLDDAGTYHTNAIVSDGKFQTEEEIIIFVENKNQLPKIENKKILVEETETISLKPLISDPDNDTLKFIFQEPFNKDGIWQTTYDDAGTHQTKIIASDLEFKTTKTIEIEIKDKNRPPEIISSFSSSKLVQLTEDSTFRFSISVQDLDSDILTYSWQLEEKEISQQPSFSHYFDFETSGTHKLTLIVSDQKSETQKTWILKIENINRPPEVDLSDVIVNEGEKIILQLPEKDIDGDLISYTFQPPFQNNTWQTNHDDAGTYTILITASDGELTTKKEIRITIKDVDRAPFIDLDKKITLDENEKLRIDLKDLVFDPDNDEPTITIKNLPQDAAFTSSNLKWRPSYDFVQRKSNFFTKLLN